MVLVGEMGIMILSFMTLFIAQYIAIIAIGGTAMVITEAFTTVTIMATMLPMELIMATKGILQEVQEEAEFNPPLAILAL